MNIGIDIGGSHIAVGLVDENNNIILKKEYNWSDKDKESLYKSIEKYCKKMIKEIISEKNIHIKKIGIGYPSKNIIDGVIYNNNNESFDLCKVLKDEFNVDVYLKNDVKCSAMCEKNIGNLIEYDNCIFMTLGTGIGGAYFYKNQLVIPNMYQGFEIGHMIIEKDGKECRCGKRGCLEEYASMRAFRKDIQDLFNIGPFTSYDMFNIINAGEKLKEVDKIIDNYLENLSIGINNLINIFEPDAICIGGSFAYYEEIFIEKLKKKIQHNFKDRNIPDILVAKFKNDAGIIGASMLESN